MRPFIERLQVPSKAGPLVTLNPWREQAAILEALAGGEDLLILKPRQIGASTIVAAYYLWQWLTSPDPITLVVLSHKQKSSKHLLRKIKAMYRALPDFLQLPLSIDNADHLQIDATGAAILAIGAGDDGGTRSFTAQYIWLSEFAFSPNAAELLTTAEGSLTAAGQIIAESTANHWGDAMHEAIQQTQRGAAAWRVCFFPWTTHAEYATAGEELNPTEAEGHLIAEHGLTADQLRWRRRKIGKIGGDKFRREYPLSIEDAYSQGAGAYLTDEVIGPLIVLHGNDTGAVIYEPHNPGQAYAAGFDPGGGVGLDYSDLTILNVTTGRVAARWRARSHSITDALEELSRLCVQYRALLIIEANNHGYAYIEAIRSLGAGVAGLNLWVDSAGKPWFSTAKSRAMMFHELKISIEGRRLTAVSQEQAADLRCMQVDETGRVILPRTVAGHCDSAVSLGLAVWSGRSARASQRPWTTQMIAEARAAKIRKRAVNQINRY